MSDAPTPPAAPTRSREVLQALEAEMAREDQEVVFPLMERMREVADALAAGRPIDPGYLETGFRAWHEYIEGVHQQRLSWLATVVDSAPLRIGTRRARGGRLAAWWHRILRRTAAVAPSAAPSLESAYADIAGTQARMAQRIAVLEELVDHYRRHEYYADQMIASLVRSGAFSDRAWAKYEEEFVLRTLDEHLLAERAERLAREVVAAHDGLEGLRTAVREFLSRPVAARPHPDPAVPTQAARPAGA